VVTYSRECVSTVTFARVLGTGDGVASCGASIGTDLDGVGLVIEDLDGKESTILTLGDNSVGGPAGGEDNSGGDVGGINVDVDGVGSTTDLRGISRTGHFALARDQGVLNILKGTTVTFRSIL